MKGVTALCSWFGPWLTNATKNVAAKSQILSHTTVSPGAILVHMVKAGRRVLIVDDSVVVRRNLKQLLSDQPGIDDVQEASSVASALLRIVEEQPDAVIVDIQLPDGTGFEVLEHLAEQVPRPLAVVLTNYPDQYNRERAAELGVEYFFDKSFEYERLLEVLQVGQEEKS